MKMFDNIRNKILTLSLVTIICGVFQGCASMQTKSPEIPEIIANIQKVTDLSPMEKGNKTKLRKLYSISTKEFEDFALYAPKTNMQANEILILKVKSQDDMDALLENIENIIEKQSSSFKDYSPDQYELLENHTLEVKGKYLILIVSKDVDKITKAVNDSFK
jgi:Zn-dependent M32 family carboxypeptidase